MNGHGLDTDSTFMDRLDQILGRVEPNDFDRVEPPAGLWGRIETEIRSDQGASPTVQNERPKEPPSRHFSETTVVEYRVDSSDLVSPIGQNWAEFARDNHAPELSALRSDQTLWTYFDGDEVRELWQLLLERVRGSQKAVQVPLRCDAPHARRWFDMSVIPESNGGVRFRSVLVFEEPRTPVALLDPLSERDDGAEPVLLCSWCGRGQSGEAWLDIEELVQAARLLEKESMPPISQGICGTCRDEMSADLLVADNLSESGD